MVDEIHVVEGVNPIFSLCGCVEEEVVEECKFNIVKFEVGGGWRGWLGGSHKCRGL